jgi:hypothetical protein
MSGMANTKPKTHDKNFTMRVDEKFYEQLDDIRADSRPVLSRTETVRHLVADKWREITKGKRK